MGEYVPAGLEATAKACGVMHTEQLAMDEKVVLAMALVDDVLVDGEADVVTEAHLRDARDALYHANGQRVRSGLDDHEREAVRNDPGVDRGADENDDEDA